MFNHTVLANQIDSPWRALVGLFLAVCSGNNNSRDFHIQEYLWRFEPISWPGSEVTAVWSWPVAISHCNPLAGQAAGCSSWSYKSRAFRPLGNHSLSGLRDKLFLLFACCLLPVSLLLLGARGIWVEAQLSRTSNQSAQDAPPSARVWKHSL
jgi:hypothetical protein